MKKLCLHCGEEMPPQRINRNTQTCSEECSEAHRVEHWKKNSRKYYLERRAKNADKIRQQKREWYARNRKAKGEYKPNKRSAHAPRRGEKEAKTEEREMRKLTREEVIADIKRQGATW